MSNKKIGVDRVAQLANIKLSPKEEKQFEKQLQEILAYIDTLKEVKTDNIEPVGQITGLENITRADNPAPSLSQDQALKNAPRTHNGFIEVDAVFENND